MKAAFLKVKQLAGNIYVIVLFGTALRLALFSGFVMGDDPGYADFISRILQGTYPPFCDTCVFSFRPLVLYPSALSMAVLGWSPFSFVLPVLLSSIFTIYVIYWIGTILFNRPAALLAAFLLTVFPLNLVHATTMTNDIVLSFCIALSVLFFLKAVTTENKTSYINYLLSGMVLGACMGIKINSLSVIGLFIITLAALALAERRFRQDSLFLFAGWLFVQALFCFIYYLKTNDPFAHIHTEITFNRRFITSSYPNTWQHVREMLLFYPRYMFGIVEEGHPGYTFKPYGYFYCLLPLVILLCPFFRNKKVYFPILWVVYLFAVMEFSAISIRPYYQPIHRLPRFIEILTVPTVLLTAFFLSALYTKNRFLKFIVLGILLFLTGTSLFYGVKKAHFYRDSIADGKKAFALIQWREFNQIITDHEMKNLLLFHRQFKNRNRIKSFEYDHPAFTKNSILIFGGSRRQDMPPSYTLQFYPATIPHDWRKIAEIESPRRLWRPKNLVFYKID